MSNNVLDALSSALSLSFPRFGVTQYSSECSERHSPHLKPTAVHELIQTLKQQLTQKAPQAKRLWVAYSGGVDSTVLLHAVARLYQEPNTPDSTHDSQPTLGIFHVSHGLFHQTAQLAIAASQQYQCPLVLANLQVRALPGQSLEEAARKARYQAFTRWMQPGDYLLLAHHQEDQAETLLGRLIRGNGASGGMPDYRPLGDGHLLRPWLDCPKASLLGYAQSYQLSWSEDPSNQNTRFLRNYLRLEVLPVLKAHHPQVIAHLAHSARVIAEQIEHLAALALADAGGGWSKRLALETLQALPQSRQENLLRAWITAQGAPLPTAVALQNFLVQCNADKVKTGVDVHWKDFAITRYQDYLYWRNRAEECQAKENGFSGAWDGSLKILADGTVLTQERIEEALALFEVAVSCQDTLRIDYRREGEQLLCQGKMRRLKSLLQDWGVPHWQRDSIACIYIEDRLVAAMRPVNNKSND